MVRYAVDVKAFFSFEVDAETPEEARLVADCFIEHVMVAESATVEGYNSDLDAPIGTVVPAEIIPSIDGESDVEKA